ncbi:hypothetical protein KSS87_015956 [Heliosperma pusillum]|nr:hypothetical protein KSS87_015720 [Heliosperma pusillum]KAH9607269.1 hypothetical protein KSS87_006223 [Heliosperma pusillum]KAH9615885.1 hypothetical protein KSS87_015956 [Heliosperma pusillum]
MDRHGSTDEHTQSDQRPIRLQEGMWQLGLGETTSYPVRPGEPDCIYYLRKGFCGYGDRCRFNHPLHRFTSQAVGGVVRLGGVDYPERSGQPICQYYMRTGSCKFGSSCKYDHPRQGASSDSSFGVNIYGYPMRPGEKECAYYMKTGQCKFGMTCKYHHPQPDNVPVAGPTPGLIPQSPSPAAQPYGMVAGSWSAVRPSMMPGSYIQGPYGPMLLSPGVAPFSGWAPYPAPNPMTTPTTPPSVGAGQLYGLTQLSPSAPAYTGGYQALLSTVGPSSGFLKEHSYPQRPGQPECQYYLKTGECKFGSSCKYHHPAEWVAPETSSALSPMGLPLRPGTPTCSYYAAHGVCKYGPACKFDHPMGTLSYCPSASSLSDMPVAPYPVGSLTGTLAASSSSSDLRAEVSSGPTKEPATTLTSSLSISSGSVGSVSSKSGSISQSDIQQSSQKVASSGTGTGTTTTTHTGAPS